MVIAFGSLEYFWSEVWHKADETKYKTMLLTIILVLAVIAAFAMFFKSIDFFDKI